MYHRIAVGESAWLHDIGHGGDEHPAINQFRDVDGVFATSKPNASGFAPPPNKATHRFLV